MAHAFQDKNILFIGGANGKDEWMLTLAKEFKKRHNSSAFYLDMVRGGKEYLIERGVPSENIWSFDHNGQTKVKKADVGFIAQAEKKYDFRLWDLWQITAPRKKSRLKLPKETIMKWGQFIIEEAEEMIEKYSPDFVVLQGMASFSIVIIHNMLKAHGVEVLTIVNARIPNRFGINNNLQDEWELLKREYGEVKKRGLSAEEMAFAEKFMHDFREKPFLVDGLANVNFGSAKKKKVALSTKLNKYKLYLKILRHRKRLPDLRQFMWPYLDKVLDKTGAFEEPVEGEEFAYYGLHVDPEASTSLFGNLYVNQIDVIEKISKSLPVGYMLYVKENPYHYSSRPYYFRKEIRKFPNVRLISPHVNSIGLIKKSSLILTVTGTIGWEAIILQKPVITFGGVYYNVFDEVSKVGSILDLKEQIAKRISGTVDKKKTMQFITALFSATFEGNGSDPGDCNNASLKPKNISLLLDGMENYVSRVRELRDKKDAKKGKKE